MWSICVSNLQVVTQKFIFTSKYKYIIDMPADNLWVSTHVLYELEHKKSLKIPKGNQDP